MKSKMITLMLGMATILASCSQEEVLQDTTDCKELTPVTITAALPDGGMRTRAVTESDDEAATNAYMQVLVKSGTDYVDITDGDLADVRPMTKSGDAFTLSGIYLDPEQEYRFLFWADNVGTAPADLQSVAYTAGSIAFATYKDWDNTSTSINVNLKHVVSKVTLKTTTSTEAGVKVSITGLTTYTTYNVNKLDTDLSPLSGKETDRAFEAIPDAVTVTDKAEEVFSFYALTDTEVQNLTINRGNIDLTVPNVPVAPNKHTILVGDVGNIGEKNVTFTTEIDETWGDEIVNIEASVSGNTITMDRPGQLTAGVIDKAVGEGTSLTIEGSDMNESDFNVLTEWLKAKKESDKRYDIELTDATRLMDLNNLNRDEGGIIRKLKMPNMTTITDEIVLRFSKIEELWFTKAGNLNINTGSLGRAYSTNVTKFYLNIDKRQGGDGTPTVVQDSQFEGWYKWGDTGVTFLKEYYRFVDDEGNITDIDGNSIAE